jgi:hypothetical protein
MSFTLIDKAYIANAKQITQIVEGIGWVKPSESFKQVVPITSKNIPSIKYDQAFIVFSLGPIYGSINFNRYAGKCTFSIEDIKYLNGRYGLGDKNSS